MKTGRNYIQMKTGRLKSYDSVCKKMQKKGLDMNFAQAVEKINDLIGVRAVCAYVDDIYKVADLIQKQQLQLRTAAMDYWANLDHQLRYKRGQKQAAVINEELQQCASMISQLDQKMLAIRKKIDKI